MLLAKRILLSVAFVLVFSSLSMAEEKTENVGSTSINGYLTTRNEGDFVNINAELIVVKSGMNGVGKGHLEFALLDENFETKKPVTIDLTVGAKFPEGTHKEGESKTLKIPKGKFFGLVWAISGANDEGIPANLPDIIKSIGKAMEDVGGIVKVLSPGSSSSLGGLSFIRF